MIPLLDEDDLIRSTKTLSMSPKCSTWTPEFNSDCVLLYLIYSDSVTSAAYR